MSPRSFSRRFFVDYQIMSDHVQISGPSAHHMMHVIRVAPGDEVILFDGSGCEFPAIIEKTQKSELSARIIRSEKISREIRNRITIAAALPKGDRQKFLVEKLVEAGVARLIPVNANRSIAKADRKTIQKFRRQIIEASKQCGRNQLMEIGQPMTTRELFGCTERVTRKLIANPDQNAVSAPSIAEELTSGDSVIIAIGPEGGFEPSEIQSALAAGWRTVTVGPATLRIETAAVVVATMFGLGLE